MATKDDEQAARLRGEQVTLCPVCGKLVADPLLWGHEEGHARKEDDR